MPKKLLFEDERATEREGEKAGMAWSVRSDVGSCGFDHQGEDPYQERTTFRTRQYVCVCVRERVRACRHLGAPRPPHRTTYELEVLSESDALM